MGFKLKIEEVKRLQTEGNMSRHLNHSATAVLLTETLLKLYTMSCKILNKLFVEKNVVVTSEVLYCIWYHYCIYIMIQKSDSGMLLSSFIFLFKCMRYLENKYVGMLSKHTANFCCEEYHC